MIYLILDTNIYINLLRADNRETLLEIIDRTNKGEIILLTNSEIIKEWDRNKNNVLIQNKKIIDNQLEKIRKETGLEIGKAPFLDEIEKNITEGLTLVESLIQGSTKTEITDRHKIIAAQHGQDKKAPFHSGKNSTADMLILLSSIDYVKENTVNLIQNNEDILVSDSLFISQNYKDFSKGVEGKNRDIIHPDLAPYLDSVGTLYFRNFQNIPNMISGLSEEVGEYIDSCADAVVDQMIDGVESWR